MLICAALLVLSAALSAVRSTTTCCSRSRAQPVAQPECLTNCPVGAPPLEPSERVAAPRTADRH